MRENNAPPLRPWAGKREKKMKPVISIIMGSTSDLPVMEPALNFLEQQEIPFEVNAL